MSATIDGGAEALLKGKNFANVATLRADGSAQVAPALVRNWIARPKSSA